MKRYRLAVSALVLRPVSVCLPDGECKDLYEMLLVHKPRKRDDWQLPQGGVEPDEDHETAARRELMEEVHLKVGEKIHESPDPYTYEFPPEFVAKHNPYNDGQTLVFLSFLADPDAVVKVDDHEVDGHVWVLPEKLSKYIKREIYLNEVLRVYEESLKLLQEKKAVR